LNDLAKSGVIETLSWGEVFASGAGEADVPRGDVGCATSPLFAVGEG
jgi:hypothetical protein